jgi:8-amino-7-oxononanoate synthase
VYGAFVAGEADVVEWLVQRGRTYVFTTGTPPMLACALLAALRLIESEEWRRERLQDLAMRLRNGLAGTGFNLLASQTAIQPIIVGNSESTVVLGEKLLQAGVWVPAIRPPTVPEGTARLRISLSAAHSRDDVDRLVAALREVA